MLNSCNVIENHGMSWGCHVIFYVLTGDENTKHSKKYKLTVLIIFTGYVVCDRSCGYPYENDFCVDCLITLFQN